VASQNIDACVLYCATAGGIGYKLTPVSLIRTHKIVLARGEGYQPTLEQYRNYAHYMLLGGGFLVILHATNQKAEIGVYIKIKTYYI
jgi:hypothetical protein